MNNNFENEKLKLDEDFYDSEIEYDFNITIKQNDSPNSEISELTIDPKDIEPKDNISVNDVNNIESNSIKIADNEDFFNLDEIQKEHGKIVDEKQKKKKLKLAFKSLSSEDRKKIKDRAKLVKKLNKAHTNELRNIPLENSENIIELRNVRKMYSNGFIVTEILKGIDLDIKKGELVIILGPSGSGKTTLMNIISGLDRASKGVVNVAGENLITFKDSELTNFRKKHIGYVFQQYGLLPNLTVKENIEIGSYLQKDVTKKRDVNEILESLGITEHANKFPHQLSGGQQQRVSIARAFAKNPLILFGDEPTGAVDEEMSKVILNEFVKINEKYKTTIIIVTHNPIFADLGNKVIKIKDGRIHELITNENPKKVEDLAWGLE